MLWWCKCPFYLMCPSRMWLALFRLCQCLSTSGPDRRSTWCPIRVVLLAMCAVKIPLHYSFVTQCVEVFFLSVKFRHNSVCVGVRWHGLKKKWNKTSSYFMYLFSSVSAVWIEWGVSTGGGAHLFTDTMQHQKAKLFYFVSRFMGQFCHQETTHLNKEIILVDWAVNKKHELPY